MGRRNVRRVNSRLLGRILALALAGASTACATTSGSVPLTAAPRQTLAFVADFVLPSANAAGRPRPDVGGLSGAYFDRRFQRLYAVVDDRLRPRIIGFDVQVEPALTLVRRELVPLAPPAADRTLDAEGLAPAPNGHWFVSSEGDRRGETRPVAGIHEYARDGRYVRSMPLPPAYADTAGAGPSGMRLNLSLEALSISPDNRWIFAALESSLLQDGPAADFERGAVVRLLVYDLHNAARPPREYAYLTDNKPQPVGWSPIDGDAGVVDVLALNATDLLVLERGYVVEDPTPTSRRENSIRIYWIRLSPAAEVTGRYSLEETPPAALLQKHLVFDLADVAPQLNPRLRRLENFEAIAFGPRLADGNDTILLISDDNFSPSQVTAVVALRWTGGRR